MAKIKLNMKKNILNVTITFSIITLVTVLGHFSYAKKDELLFKADEYELLSMQADLKFDQIREDRLMQKELEKEKRLQELQAKIKVEAEAEKIARQQTLEIANLKQKQQTEILSQQQTLVEQQKLADKLAAEKTAALATEKAKILAQEKADAAAVAAKKKSRSSRAS